MGDLDARDITMCCGEPVLVDRIDDNDNRTRCTGQCKACGKEFLFTRAKRLGELADGSMAECWGPVGKWTVHEFTKP